MHTDKVMAVKYAGDGKLLASAGCDSVVHVYDALSFAPVRAMSLMSTQEQKRVPCTTPEMCL